MDWWPTVRRRLLRTSSLRGTRTVAAVVGLACMLALVESVHPFPSPLLAAPVADSVADFDKPPVAGSAPLHIREAAYSLWAEPTSSQVTVASPSGRIYTTLPLCALIGRTALPDGVTARTTVQRGALHTRLRSPSGALLADAILDPSPQSFTVSFSAPLGPSPQSTPRFFTDGAHGLAMSTVLEGFTPDARGPSVSGAPSVSTVGRTPLAPPPFDVELRTAAGWFGVGLVQLPDATTMSLGHDGAISVDYPLGRTGGTDVGACTAVDGSMRLPDFVVTFAGDPIAGLRAYHDALTAEHAVAVASPPGSRPQWWSEPLVDTWGEQMATGAQRGSPHFGADWVRSFVRDWRARYHVQHFTVVIDSRWQARIGDSLPDPLRFGGVAGMRKLVDELHAQGLHVMLWWPMWARRIDVIPMSARQARLLSGEHVIDPTAPDFETTMARTVEDLVGTGPGELNADGLKLDWQYDIPDSLGHAEQAWGARALYRYMDTIHTVAHALRHDAMIDASAAAPQFADVADAVRLYDAWSAAEWDRRAAIVAAADPDMLIDGDGWQTDNVDTLPHTVASTVYGTPAVYFSSTWLGGTPIPADVSDQVGAVVALSALKGQGRAVPLPGDEWEYQVGRLVTARTFAGDRALVVRSATCTPTWRATVVTTVGGRVLVPMSGRRLLGAVDSLGRRAVATPNAHGVMLTMRAGGVYTLTFSGGC